MRDAAFALAGTEVVAGLSGALVLPAERALVVADLHLEKGSSLARRGRPLPPYDSRATLAALEAAIAEAQPLHVVCLGDSFHDDGGPARLSAEDTATLRRLMAGRDWTWIFGNHDRTPPRGLGGAFAEAVCLGSLTMRHEALAGDSAGEVSGHFHPRAAVLVGRRRIARRCFVTDGERLILPAFGMFTGGLDVFDPAIAGLLAAPFTAYVLGSRRVHALSSARLHRSR